MNEEIDTKRDRLIRFEELNVKGKPNLLSWYEKDKNLIHIDQLQADRLPTHAIDRLMFTTMEYTRVTRDRSSFEPYSDPYNDRKENLAF